MDPVSVFNALYDTKCLKFGQHDLKSGQTVPYHINLQRLPLYPKLLDAVVTQVVERFLTGHALVTTTSQVRSRKAKKETEKSIKTAHNKQLLADSDGTVDSDTDSQLEEEIESNDSDDGDWEKVCDNLEPLLCGVSHDFGAPLAGAIAYKAQLPYLTGRQEAKLAAVNSDQQQQQPELFNKSSDKRQRVILIEDTIYSGESMLETVKSIEEQGDLKVEYVICIVDRELNEVNAKLEQAGIRVLTLYSMSAILRILETTGRITSEQFVVTRQWMARNSQFTSIGKTNATIKCSPTKPGDMSPTESTIEVAAN